VKCEKSVQKRITVTKAFQSKALIVVATTATTPITTTTVVTPRGVKGKRKGAVFF
jgi:hypothetical protein